MITTALYENTLGITCVEKSFLAFLQNREIEFESCLFRSFVPFHTVLEDFMSNGHEYTSYLKIPRIQTTCDELNLARIQSVNNISFKEMLTHLNRELNENKPILLEVDNTKIVNNGIIPWRNDHYIMAHNLNEGKISYINDYPLQEFHLSEKESEEMFCSNIILFHLKDAFNREAYNEHIDETFSSFTYDDSFTLDIVDIEGLQRFRDALGILRVSRRRIVQWFQWLKDSCDRDIPSEVFSSLEAGIAHMDSLYTALEYQRIRKRINMDKITEKLTPVLEQEQNWIEMINTQERK